MKRIILSVCLALCLSPFAVPSAFADISSEQAAQIATSQFPGRVIDVKLKNDSYRVKVLDQNGSMHIVIIDKSSGKIKSAN